MRGIETRSAAAQNQLYSPIIAPAPTTLTPLPIEQWVHDRQLIAGNRTCERSFMESYRPGAARLGRRLLIGSSAGCLEEGSYGGFVAIDVDERSDVIQ